MAKLHRLLTTAVTLLALLGPATGSAFAIPMLLVDMDTGEVLFQEEAGVPWHPASLTKLMTAYVAFQAIADGRISLDDPIRISANAVNEAPSTSGLPVDSYLTLRDALYILIVKSANDIAVAIAEAVGGNEKGFVAEMNATAQRLGLTATHFENPNGLPNPGQVTSARDLGVLSMLIRKQFPQYLPMFATEHVVLGKARFSTNNNLLNEFEGTTGMKTGYVCGSGLNIVATAARGGKNLLAVVLGGSSSRERGELTAQLLLRGFAGALKGTGQPVLQLSNQSGVAPADMTPLLCGKQAKTYLAERAKEFPLGLKGEPSYLTDKVTGPTYTAKVLGRFRDVALPRVRPAHEPQFAALDWVKAIGPEVDAATGLVAPVPMPRLKR